jgi:hypothetical protein
MKGVRGLPARVMIATAVAAVSTALTPVRPTAGQIAPFCQPGQSPQFVLGFADLRSAVGDAMGDPIECEHADPENGDSLQRTTSGLSFYRKSTNTLTFTDGFNHWGLTTDGTDGLVTWTGASIDPPGVTPPQTAAPAAPSAIQPPPSTATSTPIAAATATPTPPTTPTPAPPTSTPAPALGSRANPIPLGAVGRFTGSWNVVVASVIPDATSQVLARNRFNDRPAPGQQFFIALIQATYTGRGSARFGASHYRLHAVGGSAAPYTTFENNCGVIPDEISDDEVFTGGTVAGSVCWAIRSSDASSLVMYDGSSLTSPEARVFFSLH